MLPVFQAAEGTGKLLTSTRVPLRMFYHECHYVVPVYFGSKFLHLILKETNFEHQKFWKSEANITNPLHTNI